MRTYRSNMKKYLKIIMFSVVFLTLNSRSDDGAVDINFYASLVRTVGTSEAVIDLSYSTPEGSFKIDEIWVSGHKMDVPKKEGKTSVGCEIVLSSYGVQYKNQKIPFDPHGKELSLKTKWRGEKSEEFIEKYALPPDFEISAVSDTISNTTPLTIELKGDLIYADWDNCGLIFSNEKRNIEKIYLSIYLKDFSSIRSDLKDTTTKKIVMKLDAVQKNRADQKLTATENLSDNFYTQLACTKEYKRHEHIVEDRLYRRFRSDDFTYQLFSDAYLIKITQ